METTRAPAVMYAAVCWADCVSAPVPAAPAPDEAKRRAVLDEAARRAKVRRALEESMVIRWWGEMGGLLGIGGEVGGSRQRTATRVFAACFGANFPATHFDPFPDNAIGGFNTLKNSAKRAGPAPVYDFRPHFSPCRLVFTIEK